MSSDTHDPDNGEWAETHRPIVIAVDGSERNLSAVAWGASEAAAEGCQVVLVTALQAHVVRRPARDGELGRSRALDMLADVRTQVRRVVDAQTVDIRAVDGAPVEVLLEEATDSRLVVVGKRGLGGFARMLVGSTSIALAGRSPIPVAIIPDRWEASAFEGRPVVLGVDPAKPDHNPTHLAFRRARRLGVPLVAVHGWETPSAYSWDTDSAGGAVAELDREGERLFTEFLTTWTERFPDVSVRPMRRHGHPATAVLEAAEEAQLVVLGRHAAGVFGGFAFGSVGRAVLHYSETPVIVVPAGQPAG